MEIGISTACFFRKLVVEDTIDVIRNLGTHSIEVFLNTFSEYTNEYAKFLKQRIDDAGLSVISVHPQGIQFELALFSPYERSRADSKRVLSEVFESASILGAKYYIMHGGMNLKPARKALLNYDMIAKRLAEAADIAADYGISIAYENVHWSWFHFPEFADELLRRMDHPNFYFNLDVKQAMQSNKAPEEFLAHMDAKLANVHVCDCRADGKYINPCMPFSGEADFPLLAQKLKEIDYNGAVILEVYSDNYHSYEELKRTIQRLRELFEG